MNTLPIKSLMSEKGRQEDTWTHLAKLISTPELVVIVRDDQSASVENAQETDG